MDEGHCDVPGGRIAYRVLGDGGGAPLLCLHGGPGFPSDSLGTLGELAASRPVVLYDQLGCGASDRPDDPDLWRTERFVEEIVALRAALGLEEVHVLGHSWGGLLAVEYALTGPPGLRSLVLASPVISVPRWVQDAERLLAALPPETRETIARCEAAGDFDAPEYAAAKREFASLYVCRMDPRPPEMERAHAGFGVAVYRSMWGPSEFTCMGSLAGQDLSPRLAEIDLPVLWTCGRHDEATPETLAWLQSELPGSELRVFEASAHMPHLEERDAYLETLADFLERADA